jgi:ADP-ribose pyrophosphatase
MEKIVPHDAVTIPNAAKRVFKGQIFDVYQWQQERYDGSFATFEMLRRPDTVETIGIVDDKIIVLTDEQPNRGAKRSFAGGRVDPGEQPNHSAVREVKEETGYEFAHYKLIEAHQPQSKVEWFIYTYIAWNMTGKTQPHLDPGERIEVELLPYDEVKRLVLAREGHLGGAHEIFSRCGSIEDLLNLPEYAGRVADVVD